VVRKVKGEWEVFDEVVKTLNMDTSPANN